MTDHLLTKIKALANRHWSEFVTNRRHLHQYPELSFQEVETGRFIAQRLKAMNIPFVHGIADNGVVAKIEGRNPHKAVVALRADIDALPIQEANDVPYCSKNEGVMHACGHDVHTSSLLGTAQILQTVKDDFEGTVKLLFQPAEERLPGGASLMIKEGALKNPTPSIIIGQHVHPPLEAGTVGLCPGKYMASADELFMEVTGKGGHGALPHNCVDTVLMTAHILTALQQIVSRNANPIIPSVLTFGKIYSDGGATNVIPNKVHLQGTFRTMNEEWRFKAHQLMKNMAHQIALSMGGQCDLDIKVGYPTLYNDPSLTNRVKVVSSQYLGETNVKDLDPRMTAEDFAYYSQVIPACFYRLGTGNKAKGIQSPIHTNTFDVDEKCLETSTGLMAWLAIAELRSRKV